METLKQNALRIILSLQCIFQAAIIKHGYQQLPDSLHRIFKSIFNMEKQYFIYQIIFLKAMLKELPRLSTSFIMTLSIFSWKRLISIFRVFLYRRNS